jgi:hypothetical protein
LHGEEQKKVLRWSFDDVYRLDAKKNTQKNEDKEDKKKKETRKKGGELQLLENRPPLSISTNSRWNVNIHARDLGGLDINALNHDNNPNGLAVSTDGMVFGSAMRAATVTTTISSSSKSSSSSSSSNWAVGQKEVRIDPADNEAQMTEPPLEQMEGILQRALTDYETLGPALSESEGSEAVEQMLQMQMPSDRALAHFESLDPEHPSFSLEVLNSASEPQGTVARATRTAGSAEGTTTHAPAVVISRQVIFGAAAKAVMEAGPVKSLTRRGLWGAAAETAHSRFLGGPTEGMGMQQQQEVLEKGRALLKGVHEDWSAAVQSRDEVLRSAKVLHRRVLVCCEQAVSEVQQISSQIGTAREDIRCAKNWTAQVLFPSEPVSLPPACLHRSQSFSHLLFILPCSLTHALTLITNTLIYQ